MRVGIFVLIFAVTPKFAHASGLYPSSGPSGLKDCASIAGMRSFLGYTPSHPTSGYPPAPNLEARWNPTSADKIGIRDLFNSRCLVCHAKPAGQSAPSPDYLKYNACANCHAGKNEPVMSPLQPNTPLFLGTYPENLDFYPGTNEIVPPALLARSYYSPGLNKAAASLVRVADGSMPPQHTDYVYDGNGVATAARGWCYQIVMTYRAWINAGYPL